VKKRLTHLLLKAVLPGTLLLPLAMHGHAQQDEAEAAQTLRYVSDVMYIPLRKGPGNSQDVLINGLVSGTPLTFVREETDSNRVTWSLVRTSEGVLGWARNSQLLTEPPAGPQLGELQQRYDALSKEYESLKQSSAMAVDIEKDNQRLHESHQVLQTRADYLQAENDQLKNSDRYNQWIYGGGLLLAGVLLSLILQAFGKRKRQSEWR
jgi:SH3 domain protein